jgi:hypothetical protein
MDVLTAIIDFIIGLLSLGKEDSKTKKPRRKKASGTPRVENREKISVNSIILLCFGWCTTALEGNINLKKWIQKANEM